MFPGWSVSVSGSGGSPGLSVLSGPAGVPVVLLSVPKMRGAVSASPGVVVVLTRAAWGCVGVAVFVATAIAWGPAPVSSMGTWGSMIAAAVVRFVVSATVVSPGAA